jgi:hypothetical protein
MWRYPRVTTPLNPSIDDSPPSTLAVLLRIISRESWDGLRVWRAALPGSRIEHVLFGIYAQTIPPSGAGRLTRRDEGR